MVMLEHAGLVYRNLHVVCPSDAMGLPKGVTFRRVLDYRVVNLLVDSVL